MHDSMLFPDQCVLTCQTVSHSLVKSILLSTLSRHYKRLAYDFWNHSKGRSSMPWLTFRNCNFWHFKDINLTKSQKLFFCDAKNQQIENPKCWLYKKEIVQSLQFLHFLRYLYNFIIFYTILKTDIFCMICSVLETGRAFGNKLRFNVDTIA